MNVDPFAGLYDLSKEREAFGAFFCGPSVIPHNEWTLVARAPCMDGDRATAAVVKVYELAVPAAFFNITVNGVLLSTGSGQLDLVLGMLKAFSAGMLAAVPAPDPHGDNAVQLKGG